MINDSNSLQLKKTPILNQLLLIAGTGRNTGKTTIVCTICNHMPPTQKPVCIKISNHFHSQPGAICLLQHTNYTVYEEKQVNSDKDTARMIAAGASRVFFIEAENDFIYPAFKFVFDLIPPETPIICESGGLRDFVQPSLFILVHKIGTEPKPTSVRWLETADHVFSFDEGNLSFNENIIRFRNNIWELSQ